LITLLPELGKINRKQIASITGTAPTPKDSGTIKGYRFTNGGRYLIKKSLFLVILSKIRYDKDLKEKYEQMQLRGKKKMVAIVALMRKFIVILNAKVRDELKNKGEIK
jgi:transposase